MISTEHLDAYLEAMGRCDVEGTKAHMADDVVIRSPIAPTPFQGREQVTRVLDALLSTVDGFEPKLLLRDGADFVAVFTIRFGDHAIDGMDHMHLNDAGLVDSMTVAWRPLPAVVAVQQKLAPKLGGNAMMLVSANQAELIAARGSIQIWRFRPSSIGVGGRLALAARLIPASADRGGEGGDSRHLRP